MIKEVIKPRHANITFIVTNLGKNMHTDFCNIESLMNHTTTSFFRSTLIIIMLCECSQHRKNILKLKYRLVNHKITYVEANVNYLMEEH